MVNNPTKTSNRQKEHTPIQDSGFKYTISQLNADLLGQQAATYR